MDEAAQDRSREVGRAIQTTVAADPTLAVSIVGIGLDALSSVLINSPDQLPSFAGWVDLIVGVFDYVTTGQASSSVDSLLAGSLDVRSAGGG